MKTMKWLVQREFWEHKGSIFWAPIAVAGAIVLFIGGTVMYAIGSGKFGGDSITINGRHADMTMAFNTLSAQDQQMFVNAMSSGYMAAAAPLYIMLSVVVFFYCLSAMFDERRDRSILFWKSLPISDTSTVLSKVVSATVLAPIVAVITGIIVGMLQLLILAVTLSFHGVNVWQMLVLAHPFRVMFNLVGYIPLYVLWALPSVGWLLLCSAWARNKPFLWAVALPVATGLLVSWFGIMGLFDLPTTWFWKNIVQRGLLSVFPGTGSVFGHNGNIAHSVAGNPGMDFMDLGNTYQLLASANLWVGVVVGLGLLAGAVWFRRWRDDS